MSALTYPEALVVGLFQGVSELFPVSSLGHSVLIPAVIGGSWARDLDVSAPKSPYLAFIVGLHVATALALIIYFRRDWLRIIGGLITSIRFRRVESSAERLAWLLIVATIPVGLSGLALEHLFRTTLGKPVPAAIFLMANGVILFAGERLRRHAEASAPAVVRGSVAVAVAAVPGAVQAIGVDGVPDAADVPGQRRVEAAAPGEASHEAEANLAADERLARQGVISATLIGATQVLALLPGISRSGVTMVGGLVRGLSHEDAARFAFLLATPVILAAGALKIPDLVGPLGNGIHLQILLGSLASGIGAYVSVRFLVRYFETRTLTPFAAYCVVAGGAALAWLQLR